MVSVNKLRATDPSHDFPRFPLMNKVNSIYSIYSTLLWIFSTDSKQYLTG